MLSQFAARTVSGKTPPLAFRITLWILAIFFLGMAVFALVTWWRMRRELQRSPESEELQSNRGKIGCLMAGAVPAVLFGIFLLDWAIQVS